MNAVFYGRYSSSSQTEQSIEGQRECCKKYADENGYTIVGEYIDRAISGTIDARPQFLKMIEDSSKKGFEYVIVYQLDRFARSRFDSAVYKAKLKKNGVRVLSAKENIADDASGILVEGVLESMAEYYSAELSQKIRRGMDINAQKGFSTGGNVALGYKVVDKKFVIDETTAPIVHDIFKMYANGDTVTKIIGVLNEKGLKTSRNNSFNKNSLRKMLQNKRYIGIYTYKGTETPNVLPRIIEDDLFEKVQQKLRENKVAPARAKAKVDYLLSTKLFCGKCGANMIGNSGRSKTGENHCYYRCNGVKEKICDKKSIQKELIESIVLSEIHKLLTKKNIKKISKSIADFYKKGKDNSIEKSLEKRINENERKASKLALSLADCEIKSVQDTIFAEIEKLNKENDMLHKQLCDEKEKNKEISKEDVETFLFLLKEGKTDSIDSQRSLINIFVNKVILDDDKVTIIFNMGDSPTTVNKDLLDYIGKNQGFGFDALSSTKNRQISEEVCRFYFIKLQYSAKTPLKKL